MYHVSDVAIVGAGPAGARAAWTLARAGARVTIFDPSHPREKPCGGGVTGRALRLVADQLAGQTVAHTTIRSVRFVSGAFQPEAPKERSRISLDDNALIVAARADFDAALVSAAVRAGASLEPSRVTDVTIDSDRVRLDTTAGVHYADVVIGADGANSLVRRRVDRPFRRNQLSIATGFFAHSTTNDEVVIELLTDPAGYI